MKIETCYESAVNFMWESADNDWLLCHGIVTGTSGYASGIEYGHAWIELNHFVVDVVGNVIIEKTDYYHTGKIEYVVKYSKHAMSKILLEKKHFGPWDDKIVQTDIKAFEKLGMQYGGMI